MRRLHDEARAEAWPRGISSRRASSTSAKIGFFHGAVSAWLAEQARAASDRYLLAGDAHYTEFLSRSEVARLVSEQERTRGYSSSQLLLKLLVLEVWLASFVPRAFGADEPTRAFAVETG